MISLDKYVEILKREAGYVNKIIKIYFDSKFQEDYKLEKNIFPELAPQSRILSRELWALLYLSNNAFHSLKKLHLLYSFVSVGASFISLASSVFGKFQFFGFANQKQDIWVQQY